MRKHLLLAILISLLNPLPGAAGFQSGAGNASRTQGSSVTGTLQPAEAQADFDLMRKALEEAHTGLYRYATKAEMDRAFDAQRAKLSRPLTKLEFYAVAAEALATTASDGERGPITWWKRRRRIFCAAWTSSWSWR